MKKIIASFVLSLTLLFSFSYCAPNIYALNNFYSGSAVCYAPSNLSGGQYDNSNWKWIVSPTPTNGTAERYKDVNVVSSFSDIIMSGTPNLITSVPLVDLDRNIGKTLILPAGTCVVVHSNSLNDIISSSNIRYSVLGFDKPQATGSTSTRTPASVDSNGVASITLRGPSSEIMLDLGQYTFLYNHQSTEVTIHLADYQSTGYIDVTPTPIADVHWIVNTMAIGSSGSGYSISYAIPHIKGVADIYVHTHQNWQIATDTNVSLKTTYGNTFNSLSSATLKVKWQPSLVATNVVRFTDFTVLLNVSSSSGGSGSYEYDYATYNGCPTFLNNTIYLFPYSVNLNNVQELAKAIADALASQGGSGDYDALLRQILSELQLANTGGPLGETVHQGIQALEQQHQTIIDSADFSDFASAFEDFTDLITDIADVNSDMHWIITANNALFAYFAGFIILCCLLLTIGRIMR